MNRGKRGKSILKGGATRGTRNKRLSFAVGEEIGTPETPIVGQRRRYSDIVPTNIQGKFESLEISPKQSKKAPETKEQSQISPKETMRKKSTASEAEMSFDADTTLSKNLSCRSVIRTNFGNCYVPRDTSHQRRIRNIDTVPLGQNKRNVFASVVDTFSMVQPKANVMMIGDERIGMKIKNHLVNLHNFQTTSKTRLRAVNIELNINCCSEPDQKQISTGHFFMIIMQMDRLESQRNMQKTVQKLQAGGVPCHRIVVLSVQQSPGQHCVVVDMEEFTQLLSQLSLISYPWMEEGRPSVNEGERLLGLIHHSIGCGKGTSLLQENIVQLKNREERDDRSHFYGSLQD